jgi:hypothetical protein
MPFDAYARRQAKELFDGLADRLVKDLSTAARDETDAAVAAVRKETDATLAAVRREAEASAASAKKEADLALAAAKKEADLAVAATKKEADLAVAATKQEADAAAASIRKEADLAIAVARKEAEAMVAAVRADGDARLAAAEAMSTSLRESVEAARQEVKTLEAQLQQFDNERTQLLRARDDAERSLEAEMRRVNELAESLDAAVQEANLATQAASLAKVEADARRQDRELALDRIGVALRSIDRATGPGDILDALLDPLAHDFAKAAVFVVGAAGLRGWRARGLAAGNDITKLMIPRTSDSLLTRAVTTRKRVQVTANGGDPPMGLWGTPVADAVALPIHAGDSVIAVAYAEDTEQTSSQTVGRKIAEMLIRHAGLRLTTKGKAPSQATTAATATSGANGQQGSGESRKPTEYSPARQARRLKMQEGIEVTLDGSASSLVDMSSIGAQVLSPLALRPNRVVKMALRGDESALACKVRVMWAKFEPKGTAAAQYRVGVKFTDADVKEVDAFMAQHGIDMSSERAKPAKLKDSA